MPVKVLRRKKSATPVAAERGSSQKSDQELVRGCLQGHEEEWNSLVEKYQNLVFSIPIRYGLSRDEAADIFQAVWLDLLQDLPKLKDPKALPKWLMQVTAHKCFHWKRRSARMVSHDDEEASVPEATVPPDAELNLHEVEKEQMLRDARAVLQPRCQTLIQMLFYDDPSRPYQEVAASLGLATGSIGLLRQKCLDQLRENLEVLGFS
jgi:RNA polymerase sigma factor (sigma-70 family)